MQAGIRCMRRSGEFRPPHENSIGNAIFVELARERRAVQQVLGTRSSVERDASMTHLPALVTPSVAVRDTERGRTYVGGREAGVRRHQIHLGGRVN